MTQKDFVQMCYEVKDMLIASAPYDTGNLSRNAIKMEILGDGKARIYVDENIAPYMPFTNEVWASQKWRGKQNPNEHWWNNASDTIMQFIQRKVNSND